MRVDSSWTFKRILEEFNNKFHELSAKDMFHGDPTCYIGFGSNANNFNILNMDHCSMDDMIGDILDINKKYTRIAFKFEWKRRLDGAKEDDENSDYAYRNNTKHDRTALNRQAKAIAMTREHNEYINTEVKPDL